MTRRPLAAAAALVIALSALARPAHAEEPFALTVTGCARLDEKEIARVLGIELHAVLPREDPKRPLRIDVACDGPRTRIDAYDPITDKRLSRDVELPERAVDRDRTVAILASQLFLTSWSELLLRPAPGAAPAPSTSTPAAPDAVDAARAKARAAVAASEPAPTPADADVERPTDAPDPQRRPELWIGGGSRVRDWADPVLSTRIAARIAMVFHGRFRLALEAGFETGTATRAPGDVQFLAESATALASWRSRPLGPLTFTAGGGAGLVYAGLAGHPNAGASGASSSLAFAGDALVVFGPELALGPARVALDLSAGVTFPSLTGRVEGDRDVALAGPFAGASLLVGYHWGRP